LAGNNNIDLNIREVSSMWIKDGNGNWYLASQEIIDQEMGKNEHNSFWDKDHHGNWFLKEGTVQVLIEPVGMVDDEKIYIAS